MEKRLGKGLAQLLESSGHGGPSFVLLRTDQIRPGRYQPRQVIPEQTLEELKRSIQRHGIIEPVIVRPLAHGIYELIAGERRWRAAQAVGLQEIPALIRALGDRETLELSLVENLQREELNPIDEAKAYVRLLEEFGYTQEQLSDVVGKERSTVANALRLLKLPASIQTALISGAIDVGHAKVLLGVEAELRQHELFERIVAERLSVRQAEEAAAAWKPRIARRRGAADAEMTRLEERLRQALGTKTTIAPRRRGGRIIIEYFSPEELQRIMQLVGLPAGADE